VLASQSPRRRELLRQAGFAFITRVSAVDEDPRPGEDPEEHVCRLAKAKAEAVVCLPGEVVLAADTVVVVDGNILGKPADEADARRMLRLLAGREHLVITGVCLRNPARLLVAREITRVRFVPLSEEEIRDYVASQEPMDKAGAYAIQGLASKFIDRIEGCYFNVVGLPLALVFKLLKRMCDP
jgi:septum formation protein